jgi:hypothetical protein
MIAALVSHASRVGRIFVDRLLNRGSLRTRITPLFFAVDSDLLRTIRLRLAVEAASMRCRSPLFGIPFLRLFILFKQIFYGLA